MTANDNSRTPRLTSLNNFGLINSLAGTSFMEAFNYNQSIIGGGLSSKRYDVKPWQFYVDQSTKRRKKQRAQKQARKINRKSKR